MVAPTFTIAAQPQSSSQDSWVLSLSGASAMPQVTYVTMNRHAASRVVTCALLAPTTKLVEMCPRLWRPFLAANSLSDVSLMTPVMSHIGEGTMPITPAITSACFMFECCHYQGSRMWSPLACLYRCGVPIMLCTLHVTLHAHPQYHVQILHHCNCVTTVGSFLAVPICTATSARTDQSSWTSERTKQHSHHSHDG